MEPHPILLNVERTMVMRDLNMVAPDYVTLYDKITALVSEIIGAPVSLVSMVASNYQFFKSHHGLPEPWKSRRQTPLSHSFCQHVVSSNEPLIVSDAREVNLLKSNLAIPDLSVIGYLGIPLTLDKKHTLGSFCIIDIEPREWLPVEISIMEKFASIITEEINLKAKARLNRAAFSSQLQAFEAKTTAFIDDVDRTTSKEDFLQAVDGLCDSLGLSMSPTPTKA
ncbi:MAG: GAF domain-containing protein [Aggregatilineales bacterium]